MRNIINDTKHEKINIIVYEKDYNYFINFLIKNHINYQNLKINDNKIILTILKEDLKKINKLFKCEIKSSLGIYKIKDSILKNKIFLLSIIGGIILLFILSNIIISIKVYSSDKNIRNLIINELDNYGIKRLTFDKSYKEKEKIKKDILEKHEDTLEWLEFERKGMNLIIHVEKRIIKKEQNKDNKYCNIVATKDGLIKNVKAEVGMKVKDINDYVKKGDIIISGEIKKDEEVKKDVCAAGDVYATVWYTAYVKIPTKYEKVNITNKKRFNLKIKRFDKEYIVFKNKYKDYTVKDVYLFHFFNNKFYLQLINKKERLSKNISKDQENNMILLNIQNKFTKNLKDYEYIEDEKILKKVRNNSTIEAEVFLSVYKKIGKQETYTKEVKEGENNDREYTS